MSSEFVSTSYTWMRQIGTSRAKLQAVEGISSNGYSSLLFIKYKYNLNVFNLFIHGVTRVKVVYYNFFVYKWGLVVLN